MSKNRKTFTIDFTLVEGALLIEALAVLYRRDKPWFDQQPAITDLSQRIYRTADRAIGWRTSEQAAGIPEVEKKQKVG